MIVFEAFFLYNIFSNDMLFLGIEMQFAKKMEQKILEKNIPNLFLFFIMLFFKLIILFLHKVALFLQY